MSINTTKHNKVNSQTYDAISCLENFNNEPLDEASHFKRNQVTGHTNNSGYKSRRSEKSSKSTKHTKILKKINAQLVHQIEKLQLKLESKESLTKKFKKLKLEYKELVSKLERSEMARREQAEKIKT